MVFIDTIKYFQQSLATLANTINDKEELAVKNECKTFILKDESLSRKFNLRAEEYQQWVLSRDG